MGVDQRNNLLKQPIQEHHQEGPGQEVHMRNKPDHGESSYVGKALLSVRTALITSGDSGIGRDVAIAFAREGADIAISYLETEAEDAADTARWIEKAGRVALLLPGDIGNAAWCRELVHRMVQDLGQIDLLVTMPPCNRLTKASTILAPRICKAHSPQMCLLPSIWHKRQQVT